MDADVLAERILSDLRNTFRKDPLIDEFDILPIHESVCNKCPVIHIEHKVALEDWCVKHVYIYAYAKFLQWKKHPFKVDSETLLSWTSAILLINPEIETAWNKRKELCCKDLQLLEDELKFSEVVLSRKPKNSHAFAHRKWIFMQIKKNGFAVCSLQQVIEHELCLCTRVANLYPSNYYAWCHRTWLIKEFLNVCYKVVSEELVQMEQWISTHVSDHSGFHYRQFLISCYFNEHQSSVCCPLHSSSSPNKTASECDLPESHLKDTYYYNILRELKIISDLQAVFPGHEALWNHRRYVLHQFHSVPKTCYAKFAESANVVDSIQCKRHKIEDVSSAVDWNCSKEETFLNQCSNLAKNNFWERKLILRHIAWLKNVIAWPVNLS